MTKPFTINIDRAFPLTSSFFAVFFGTASIPVAYVSKVTGLQRTFDPIEYKQGGSPLTIKGSNLKPKFPAITMERGITFDDTFEQWATAGFVMQSGELGSIRMPDVRQNLYLVLYNERRQKAKGYFVWRGWVSEYQALPDLDAGANAVAIEHIKIEHEGWERDLSITEPDEKAPAAG